MRLILSIVCVCVGVTVSTAQSLTDSNLPIVIIAIDNNAQIPDNPRVFGNMKILDNGEGQRNFVTDQNNAASLNYNGRIEIEIRGSSSASLQKKQYGLTTLKADNVSNNNVSLLDMPKENDWVLNGLAFDPSLMRDYLSYNLSRKIGNYAPRTRYVEVIINGVYKGLYILQEKVKIDDNRVDIAKMDASDIGAMATGGYLTKADKVTWEDPSAWQMSSYIGTNDVNYIHESPKPDEITSEQANYIKAVFLSLATKANNTALASGYPSVIDIPSFVDFMLINELAANVDAYQFSTFFHKDRNGKLRAGPLWDLNLTYGNDLFIWNLDRSKTDRWQFDNGDNIGSRFWRDLFNNTTFRCYLSKRWHELTQPGQPLHATNIETFIDETVALIEEASARELALWQWEKQQWGQTLDLNDQVSGIKNFISTRSAWMTASLGSFSACSNKPTPPLVITRIHYNPAVSSGFPDSNDQEFIEIINNSDLPVDLTGVYFSGTGFVYQFTAGAILEPRGVIQLASNSETFRLFSGFSPYGEFTRNLSNDGQKITLADAFGNVIDEVTYDDTTPWPAADGTGKYLKLNAADLDNALASNWSASDEPVVSTVVSTEEDLRSSIEVYPNPTSRFVTLHSASSITSLQVHDVRGQLVQSLTPNTSHHTLDLLGNADGLYFLTLTVNGKNVAYKIMKVPN